MTVVCLGEALIDLTPTQGTSIVDADGLSVRIGGAPLNVAVNLKRMGVSARFVGALSSDGFGTRIRALLEVERVQYAPVEPVDAPTRLAVINHHSAGPLFTFYGKNPADTKLTSRIVQTAMNQDVRALYVSSLLMTHPSSARVQINAMEHARSSGTVLVVSDANPRQSAWPSHVSMIEAVESLLRYSDLTKMSLDDASELGWPENPEALILHIRERTSGAIIVTDGANGSWFRDEDGLQHVPAPPVVKIDQTGAGDAFFAAAIAGFMRDGRLTRGNLESASEAGARAVSHLGAL